MNNSENDALLTARLRQLQDSLQICNEKIDHGLREHESEISTCIRASCDNLRILQAAASASRRALSDVGTFNRLRLSKEVILCSKALEQLKSIKLALGAVAEARRWLLKAEAYWASRKFVKSSIALKKADVEIKRSGLENVQVWQVLRDSVESLRERIPLTMLCSLVLTPDCTKMRASPMSVAQASELMIAFGLYPTQKQPALVAQCFEHALLNSLCILFDGGVWTGETMRLKASSTSELSPEQVLHVGREHVNELIASYTPASTQTMHHHGTESEQLTPRSQDHNSSVSKYNGIWARILMLLSDFRTLVSTMRAAEGLQHEGVQQLFRWRDVQQVTPVINSQLMILCECLTYMSEQLTIPQYNKIVIATGIGLVLMMKKIKLVFQAIDPSVTETIHIPLALTTIRLIEQKYLGKLEHITRSDVIPKLVEKFRKENWVNPIYDDWLDAIHITNDLTTEAEQSNKCHAQESDDIEALILDRYPELAKILRYNTTCYEMFDNTKISSFIDIVLDLKRVYTPSRYCGEGDALRERGTLYRYQSDIIQEILYLANSVIFIPRMRARIEDLASEIIILLLAMATRTCVSNRALTQILNAKGPIEDPSALQIRRLFQA